MSSINSLAKDLYNIINDKEKKGPKPSEPIAEVVKVDDDVVWVRLPGSLGETPVEKTMDANVGDKVRVRLSGGRAWVIGNMTVPPTGDTVAKQAILIAKGASDHARKAIEKIEEMGEFTPGEFGIVGIWYEYNMSTSNAEFIQAQGYDWSEEIPEFDSNYFIWKRTVYEYADGEVVYGDPEFSSQDQALAEVKLAQDSTNNHFWHDASGAYVTEDDEDYTTGYATRTTAAGILQTHDNKLMASWTNSGIVFYKSDGQTPYVTYGTNGITFDSSTGFQIGNDSTYLKWVKEGNTWKLRLQVDSLTVGGDPVLTEQDRLEITSIAYAYALSTSGTTIPTSGWQSTPVAPTTTQYAWTRTTVTYSDRHTAVSYTVGGKTGQNGTNGTNGTSVTITSTSVRYASQSASATGAGTTPPSSGWSTAVPSVAAGDYLWSRTIVTYSDNTSTTSYAVARNGTNGTDITSQYLSWSTTGGLTLGYNNFIQSKLNLKGDGVRIYNGVGNLGARLHAEGMTVYDGTATTESEATEVASFGVATRIGKEEDAYLSLTDTEIKGCSGNKTYFQINSQGAVQEMWVAMGNVSWTANGRYTWVLNEAHDDVKIDRGTWIEVIRSGYDYTTAWSSISTGDPFKVSLWFQYTNPRDGTKRDYKTEVDFVKGTAKDWDLYTSPDVDAFDVIYDGSNTIAIDRRAANGVYWQRITPIYKVESTTPVYTFGNSIASSNGSYSFLIGDGTQSNYPYQLVIGKYNIDTDAILVIGNGSSDALRSNAFLVDWDGDIWTKGTITVGEHASPIGTLTTGSKTVSLESGGTWSNLASITLSPGSYIVSVEAYCSTLASGKRLGVRLYVSETDGVYSSIRSVIHTSNSAAGAASASGPIVLDDTYSSYTVYVQGYQTQGSAQDVIGYIRAMRIA